MKVGANDFLEFGVKVEINDFAEIFQAVHKGP